MTVSAIIVAGGKGIRMGGRIRKQYLLLDQRPILSHTLQVFTQSRSCDSVILVVPADDVDFCRDRVLRHVERADTVQLVPGGAERQDSVYAGLAAVTDPEGIVLIHDGVRPFVSHELLTDLITGAEKYGACIPGLPVQDTLKRVDKDGRVQQTVDRSSIYSAQTPQAFVCSLIKKAHDSARRNRYLGTDDASLVERLGIAVRVIPGIPTNMKITTPEDLTLAGAILTAEP